MADLALFFAVGGEFGFGGLEFAPGEVAVAAEIFDRGEAVVGGPPAAQGVKGEILGFAE